MKILYHHRTRAEDAQGIHIREIINAFKKLGHQVEVVGMVSPEENSGRKGKEPLISGLAARVPPVIYELMEISYNFYGFLVLCKRIRRFKPDFIYERYALYTVAGIFAAMIFRIPLILEVNAPIAYEKRKYTTLSMPWLANFIERWICSHTHRTIVVSTPLKKILGNIGVPDERMIVISNGINREDFNLEIDGGQVRQKYNLNNRVVLGFVGWFKKWHGLEELLQVYVKYGMQKKNIHLLLVGDGPAFQDLITYALDHGIKDKGVTFTGAVPREEIPRYIAAFDIALQPDVTDYASPIKLFEYMAMGKGVVSPGKENIREILNNDYPGFFNPGEYDDMAQKIFKFSSSRKEAGKLGKIVKKILVEKKYFWIENARRTLALLQPL